MVSDALIKKVLDCVCEVQRNLTPGFLESVYQAALMYELEQRGISAKDHVKIEVDYKGTVVGNFEADVIVEDQIILELKATKTLAKAHEAQLVCYLTATGIETGFLVNFGEGREIRRRWRHYKPTGQS